MAERATRAYGQRRVRRLACVCATLLLCALPALARAAEAPVLAAVGDIACAPGTAGDAANCHQQQTSQLALDVAPAAVALLGDNQYESGTAAEYLGSFDPTWGRLGSLLHPVPGNHEYGTSGAAGYFGYFGVRAGDPSLGYYSYDLGAWHLIALNSNCGDPQAPGPPQCVNGSGHVTAAEVGWLDQDLASHPSDCTLAYWHHPRFSSGLHGPDGGTAALWDALYAHGADVVLNGHDHDYERFGPQDPGARPDPQHGIREFVVGTGGKSHYPFPGASANSEARNGSVFGVLFLTLRGGSYEWSYRGEDGAVIDAGGGACHSAPPAGGPSVPIGAQAPVSAALLSAASVALGSRIGQLRITPSAFASAATRTITRPIRRWRRQVGASITFHLSQASAVRFAIERKQLGRRQGRGSAARCVPPTRRNRRGTRCTRRVAMNGSFTVAGTSGANRLPFAGWLAGRRLQPGSYVLVARAGVSTGAGASAAFRVVP